MRRKPTSEFESVSLLWLLYVTIYVALPLLPTFLDPPWFLLSSHPARFDQPAVPSGTPVDLHLLNGRTSAFKNCFFGGSLPSILPSLSPWQSSALYYDCSCAHVLVHFLFGSVVPTFDVPAVSCAVEWLRCTHLWPVGQGIMGGALKRHGRTHLRTFGRGKFLGALPFAIYALKGTSSRLVWEKMVMFMGGSRMRGLLLRIWPFGEMSWGEKVILFWIKRCLESCLVPLARMGGARSRALS